MAKDIIEANEFVHPPRPFIWQDYIEVGLIALGVLAVLALLVWIMRRRIKRGPTAKAAALKAFKRAKAQWPERGAFWFTLRCNRILRDFFQRVFKIDSAAQTSREFLEATRLLNVLDETQRSWLEDYLQQCDKIRYAGGATSDQTLETFHQTAVELVKVVYRRQKAKPTEAAEPEAINPFLPGTPIPDPEAAEREEAEAAQAEALATASGKR